MKQANLFAGLGRDAHAPATDSWYTPPEIPLALGAFDLDPCGSEHWPIADTTYSAPADDGLSLPWFGRVWLNPPYNRSVIFRWMLRMAQHNCGTALVFARTDTKWFQQLVFGFASGLLFIENRIRFYFPNKTQATSGVAPSVLISYGHEDLQRMADSDLKGSLVVLANEQVAVVAIEKTWIETIVDAIPADQPISLREIYAAIEGHPKTKTNNHWRAKIRQQMQRDDVFTRLRPGVYTLNAKKES